MECLFCTFEMGAEEVYGIDFGEDSIKFAKNSQKIL